MAMIQRQIRLTEELNQRILDRPEINFSAWVREQMKKSKEFGNQ